MLAEEYLDGISAAVIFAHIYVCPHTSWELQSLVNVGFMLKIYNFASQIFCVLKDFTDSKALEALFKERNEDQRLKESIHLGRFKF